MKNRKRKQKQLLLHLQEMEAKKTQNGGSCQYLSGDSILNSYLGMQSYYRETPNHFAKFPSFETMGLE
jgi:hypothetical protein